MSYEMVFDVEKGDFEKAGEASRKIKRSLQQLGISSKVIRHIAIAGYEGEMNIAIHSDGGQRDGQPPVTRSGKWALAQGWVCRIWKKMQMTLRYIQR